MMLLYGKSYSSSPKLFFPLDSFVQSDFYVKVEKLKSEPTSDLLDIDEAWHIADSADTATSLN